MTKKLNRDFLSLKQMDKAIRKCQSKRMARANLVYLWDKYITHNNFEFLDVERKAE